MKYLIFLCPMRFSFQIRRLLNQFSHLNIADTRYKIKKYQFFKIRRVMAKDSGYYACSVSNAMGTNEVIYFLDVLVRGNETSSPRLVRQEGQNTLLVEIVMNDINLDCRVTGSRPINITW